MKFHEKLYSLRKAAGMTQNDLAERLNVSRQAVSRWEMGTAMPDVDNLVAMSDLFRVSLDYLLKENKTVAASGSEGMREPSDGPRDQKGSWLLLPIVLPLAGLGLLLNGWLYEKDILCEIGIWTIGASLVGLVGFLLFLLLRAVYQRLQRKSQ